ncbi:MAG: transketolase [Myxococcaceae bacterium]
MAPSRDAPSAADIERLRGICARMRVDIIEMLARAGSGHPGGSLSAVEIVASLYFHFLKHDPKRPEWPQRDRFVLSKGHAVPVVYAAMAEAGYFGREKLSTLRKLGSPLQGHPVNLTLPGMEANTGSLGQGLSIALGMAMAAKLEKNAFHVYCMIGDGESQEGQIWEAAMAAPKFGLDTLTVILDFNGGQIDGHVKDVMDIEPIVDKWRAFRWNVIDVDGHDLAAVGRALASARGTSGKPTFIVARTVKGKGVSFMENQIAWHGATPNPEQTEKALAEIRAAGQSTVRGGG